MGSMRGSKMILLMVHIVALLSLSPLIAGCPTECTCMGTRVVCSNSGLDRIPSGIPVDVEQLLLNNNAITSIDDDAFANFTALGQLYLNNNLLTTIQTRALTGLTLLSRLELNANELQTIEPRAFDDLGNIQTLILRENRLQSLPDLIFEKCYLLSDLDLGANYFSSDVFKQIRQAPPLLKQLDVSHNLLLSLPYLVLSPMTNLETLELANSSIAEIDVNAFIGLSSLRFLYLPDNYITELNRETFEPLMVITKMDLSGNPIQCSCDTKKFQDWLSGKSNVLDPDITCEDGGRDIDIESGDLEFLCYANATTTTVAPTQAPPGNCDRDAQLLLSMEPTDVEGDIVIKWDYTLIEDNAELNIQCREFKKTPFWDETFEMDTDSFLLTGLDLGENYVCCGSVYACGVYSCVDFDTGVAECPDVGFIIGMTFVAVLGGVLILMLGFGLVYCLQKRRDKDYVDSGKSETDTYRTDMRMSTATLSHNPDVAPPPPKPRPPPLRRSSGSYSEINPYEQYEYIPADSIDPTTPTSIGNPGYKTKPENDIIGPTKRDRANSTPAKSKSKVLDPKDPKRLTIEQYLHTSTEQIAERKPRRFTKAPNQTAKSVDNLNNGHINDGFNSSSGQQATRSSDPGFKSDANSNTIMGDEYLPPSDIALPPKSRETVLHARQRALLHQSSPSLLENHAPLPTGSTAV